MFEFIGFLGGEAADPSPGEKVDCICPIGQMQDGCGIREGRYVESQGIDFVKLLASESLKTIPFYGFLPAFLFSHPNRFRIADLCDSFPPGGSQGRLRRQPCDKLQFAQPFACQRSLTSTYFLLTNADTLLYHNHNKAPMRKQR